MNRQHPANQPAASVRVLVAEGSPMMARTIADAISEVPGIAVIGFAHDGNEALRRTCELKPDVLLLSLDIPRGDGTRVLREVMKDNPVATVMLVAEFDQTVESPKQLAGLGAVGVVSKPDLSDASDVRERLRDSLVPVVRSAGRMKVVRIVDAGAPADPVTTSKESSTPRTGSERDATPPIRLQMGPARRVILIGSSTGGPEALRVVLKSIPADFPVPIIIAQHMPQGFTSDLARILAGVTPLDVHEATDGERIRPGTIYVGRGGANVRVRSGGILEVESRVTRDDNCPSADVLFQSGALVFGTGTLAVVLTGMGSDGEQGVRAVHEAGGCVIAQDEATSRIFGMPRAAVESGCVDVVLPLPMIGPHIARQWSAGVAS